MKIIGERLRELRGTVQLSQAKMGKTFGVGQSSIYKYENDESTVPAEILMKYAEYFDVSLDYIFGRTDNPHGLYLENKPKIEKSYPEMDKFIEMCFESGTPMNERLKDTLKQTTDNRQPKKQKPTTRKKVLSRKPRK